jgi:hypothetical protein
MAADLGKRSAIADGGTGRLVDISLRNLGWARQIARKPLLPLDFAGTGCDC